MRRQAEFLTVHDGTFIVKQSITNGIDNAIDGLLGMLRGENFGKAVLTIAELDGKVSLIRIPTWGLIATNDASETSDAFSKL